MDAVEDVAHCLATREVVCVFVCVFVCTALPRVRHSFTRKGLAPREIAAVSVDSGCGPVWACPAVPGGTLALPCFFAEWVVG